MNEMLVDPRTLVAVFLLASFACAIALFYSAFRAVSAMLDRYRTLFAEQARVNLEQMYLFIDAGKLFTLNGIVLVAAGLLGFFLTGSLVLALVCCALGFAVPKIAFAIFRKRRMDRLRQQFPDGLMMIAGALRAGASLPGALTQMVGEMRPPLSQEFDLFLREQRVGVNFEEALDNLEKRVGSEDFALFASALKVSRDTGGNLAETLEQLADTLRRKLVVEGKIRALTAQGKLQGIVVGLLPIFMMIVLMQMEPVAMAPLFTEWYGWATLAFVGAMLFVGGLVIRKIINIDI
jgi:tight adherence protein B